MMMRLSDFDIFETFESKLRYAGVANFYIKMSWDETDLIKKADPNIYKERITIDEKLTTKLTLAQKMWTLNKDVIRRLKSYLKSKAEIYCRSDLFHTCFLKRLISDLSPKRSE